MDMYETGSCGGGTAPFCAVLMVDANQSITADNAARRPLILLIVPCQGQSERKERREYNIFLFTDCGWKTKNRGKILLLLFYILALMEHQLIK